jgi:hypothetical protein
VVRPAQSLAQPCVLFGLIVGPAISAPSGRRRPGRPRPPRQAAAASARGARFPVDSTEWSGHSGGRVHPALLHWGDGCSPTTSIPATGRMDQDIC